MHCGGSYKVGVKETIAAGLRYVSQQDMTTFESAIAAVEAVKNKGSATQADVTAAVQTLSAAVVVFSTTIKTDGTKTNGFTADELTALIATANEVKADVEVSTDGTDKPASVFWVTQAVKAAFDTAIGAAQNATNADRDSRYNDLVNAINTFNAAKQPGRQAKTITITGLPNDYNGAELSIYLSQTAKLTGSYVSGGSGRVQNGAVAVSLYSPNGNSPWAGTGNWYVAFKVGWATFYITKGVKSFTGDNVNIAFSDFKEPEIEPAGSITGSVSLKNVPDPRPEVEIYAEYYSASSYGGPIDMVDARYAVNADGSFSIPFTQAFLDALQANGQTLYFLLFVGSGENRYRIILPQRSVTASNLSGGNLNVGDLGEATLASVTLSGTLKVSDGGQPVSWVNIIARGQADGIIGRISLASPNVNGQTWSMTIPALQGEAVQFEVYGYDSSNEVNPLFYKSFAPAKTASVSNQSISGIDLDIGDISVGRMSGDITFTNMPSSTPYRIFIDAGYAYEDSWRFAYGNTVTVNGNSGTWTVPRDDEFLAALDSGAQTVSFYVYVQFNQSEDPVNFATIEKDINKNSLANIDLGKVSLATLTLSGTLNVTFNGQPVPHVGITVYGDQGWWLGSGTFNSSGYNAPWTLRIPALDSPTNLTFMVTGYTADYASLFSTEVATVSSASSGTISNIAINYEMSLPSSATPLSLDSWMDGTLEAGEVGWYQFTSDGSVYYVSWNDSYQGDYTKTADLWVNAYTSAGVLLFTDDSGWTTPRSISGQTGTIYVSIRGFSPDTSGTYAIKYSKSSADN